MIGRKGNLALWVLLLVLVGLDLATWPAKSESREAGPLFAPFQVSGVQRVQVFDPRAQSDQQTLELVREGEGAFRVQQALGFPARRGVVENLANGLAAMTTLDLLSGDPEGHARYGLTTDKAVRVTLLDASGQLVADLLQGDLAPGGRACYVRRTDGDEVYRAPLFTQRVRTDPLGWLDARWMPLDASLVQRIRVEQLGFEVLELRLIPGSRLEWKSAEGRTIGATKVRNLLNALTRATLVAVEQTGSPAWNLSEGTLHFEVEQAGGLVWQGSLAARSAEGPQAATVEREGLYQVRLAPAIAEAVHRAVSDLR